MSGRKMDDSGVPAAGRGHLRPAGLALAGFVVEAGICAILVAVSGCYQFAMRCQQGGAGRGIYRA